MYTCLRITFYFLSYSLMQLCFVSGEEDRRNKAETSIRLGVLTSEPTFYVIVLLTGFFFFSRVPRYHHLDFINNIYRYIIYIINYDNI